MRNHWTPSLVAVATFLALLLLESMPSLAQWSPSGAPVCLHPSLKDLPLVAADGAGGAFVAWRDFRDDVTRSYSDVFAQHLDREGLLVSGWPSEGRAVCEEFALQQADDICPDAAGGVYIVWNDMRNGDNADVYLAHLLPDGSLSPGWPVSGLPVCTQPGWQMGARLAPDGLGGVFIAWNDERTTPDTPEIFVQRILPDGTLPGGWVADGTIVDFNVYVTAPYPHGSFDIVSDGLGGAIVAWEDGREFATSGYDIYAQRVHPDASADMFWLLEGVPLCKAPGNQSFPRITADGIGGFFVAWDDRRNGGDHDIYATRVRLNRQIAAGWAADGNPVCTAPNTQQDVRVLADGSGGAFVCWEDYRLSDSDVYIQRMLANGQPDPAFPVNGGLVGVATDYQFEARMCSDGKGGAYVTWVDFQSGARDVRATHLLADGSRSPLWNENGNQVAFNPSNRYSPAIVADGAGGAIVTWSTGSGHIFAQRLADDAPVSTRLSLIDAVAEPGLVRLSWQASDGSRLVAWVERALTDQDFVRIGTPRIEAPDRLSFEDRDVPSGWASYRLAHLEGDAVFHSEITTVEVPEANAARLALAGFSPNPARGTPRVDLTLTGSLRATLELLDVSGRRVAIQEVGGLGPGRHSVHLDPGDGAELGSGVYWVRLTSGEQILTSRGVVVR